MASAVVKLFRMPDEAQKALSELKKKGYKAKRGKVPAKKKAVKKAVKKVAKKVTKKTVKKNAAQKKATIPTRSTT